MKKILLAVIVLIHFGCQNSNTSKQIDLKENSFFESAVYRDLEKNTSVQKIFFQRYFLDIDERDFISISDFDFYIIYVRRLYNKKLVYSIKGMDSLALISAKWIADCNADFTLKDTVIGNYSCIKSNRSVIKKGSITDIKSKIDSSLKHTHTFKETNKGGIKDGQTDVYYFNGKDYFILNDEYLNAQSMIDIDSSFTKSRIISQLEKL